MRKIFGWLLAAVLAGALTLGTTDAIGRGGQTAGIPGPVKTIITQMAADDVEHGTGPQRQFVISTITKDYPEVKGSDVGIFYIREYKRFKKMEGPPPSPFLDALPVEYRALLEQLQSQAPWLIAALAVIFGALQNVAVQVWVVKPFKVANEWIYQQLAGYPVLWGRALQRYRAALLESYEELKIPFRQNRPLQMKDVYVPLKAGASVMQLQEIDAYQAVTKHHRLAIKGAPGSGKTMLMRYLALTYAWGKLLLPGRPIPILLELHRVSDKALTEEKLIAALVEALDRYDFPKAERFVCEGLKRGHIMLLFDGLDEVSADARWHVARCIEDFLEKYDDCRAVFTCRTMVYNNEFEESVDRTLEVAEFSDRQIRQFLGAWAKEMPQGKSVDGLLRTLRERPRIIALARNPLLLTMIAYLYADTEFELPFSRAEFYQRATLLLLDEWQRERNHYKAVEKQRVLQHLALYNQDAQGLEQDAQQDRKAIAYETLLEQIKEVLPKLNRSPQTDTEPILKEIVERSGLLIKVDKTGSSYQFAHLTLQEFFAAEALIGDEAGLMQRFESEPGAWRETVKLWCGIATDSTRAIFRVHELDSVTGFECLADAQTVDEGVANRIIESFKARIGEATKSEELAKALGNVASNSRPRGRKVFSFLEQTIAEVPTGVGDETARLGAARALSLTNVSQAAAVLARHHETWQPARDFLIRMGNLAIPTLLGLKSSSALADLFRIGTPEAAQAFAPLLWDPDPMVTAQAAWYLAHFWPQDYIKEALKEIEIEDTWRGQAALDWVWSPFAKEDGEVLTILANRIGYLLSQQRSPAEGGATLGLFAEPRLMIPICAIETLSTVELPKQLTPEATALLEQDDATPDLSQKKQVEVDRCLDSVPDTSPWKAYLRTLSPAIQLDLLSRLLANPARPSEKEDWRNL
ncbi:MAG: NACHT domain-containing protein, partial [Cyanobacteria bacterium J06641_5]